MQGHSQPFTGQQVGGDDHLFLHAQIVEGMGRDVYVSNDIAVIEVDSHQQQFTLNIAQEGILALHVLVDVHQVEEDALADGFLLAGQQHGLLVDVEQLLFVVRQLVLGSTAQRVHRPVVEDGGASVVAREAFTVHAAFTVFLAGIQHKRVLLHQHRGYHGWHTLLGISSKEVAGNALFVVVLQEVQHVVADVVGILPGVGDGTGRCLTTDDGTHGVIHAYLVVQPVKTRCQIVAVFAGVVHLTDEHDVFVFLLHDSRGVGPEFGRHHLSHVATESVDALLRPEQQDVRHLLPRVG